MGVYFAILSSLFMAAMVITDKLLLKKLYDNDKLSAWFVSSVLGSIIGFSFTLLLWLLISIAHPNGTVIDIVDATKSIFWWQGVAIFLSGFLAIQLLKQYFYCFSYNISASTVAGWLASTPLFILVTLYIFKETIIFLGLQDVIASNPITLKFIIGFTMATFGLIIFEKLAPTNNSEVINYKKSSYHITLMVVLSVIYAILIDITLSFKSSIYSSEMLTVALMPYFWVGFASGITLISSNSDRQSITVALVALKKYWPIIVIVEIIGALIFFFEYLGISYLNAAYVALITSSHIILVYFVDKIIFKEQEQSSIFYIRIILLGLIVTGLFMATSSML